MRYAGLLQCFWCVTTAVVASMLLAGSTDAAAASVRYRSINGTGNNPLPDRFLWGAAGTPYLRTRGVPVAGGGSMRRQAYGDGVGSPARASQPGARVLSNAITAANAAVEAFGEGSLTSLFTYWGQFTTFDISHSKGNSSEVWNIPVPSGDPAFDPSSTGSSVIRFNRAQYVIGDGGVRQQVNAKTSFIDAEQIYGSSDPRARALRTLSGGKLKSSPWGGCPFNTPANNPQNFGMANPHQLDRDSMYFTGGVRGNAVLPILSLQTLFLREHNRLCDRFAAAFPQWDDEKLYQAARKWVIAWLQSFTVGDYLPVLGVVLPAFSGYKPDVNPGMDSMFTGAALRYGHSEVTKVLNRASPVGLVDADPLLVRQQYFKPGLVSNVLDLERVLMGLMRTKQNAIDPVVVDDVRNYLFVKGPLPSSDLAARNIQRGRDYGLLSYNDAREAYGLPRVASFAALSSRQDVVDAFQAQYTSIDEVDPWLGGLAEDHAVGAKMGPLFLAIITDQFTRTRDGDQYWFENSASPDPLTLAECRALHAACENAVDYVHDADIGDVIRANTNITATLSPWTYIQMSPPKAIGGSYDVGTTGEYQLQWSHTDGDTDVAFTMRLPGAHAGWVGVALGGNGMEDADFMIVTVPTAGAVPKVLDYHADSRNPGAFGYFRNRPVPDATDDLTTVSAANVGGVATISWTRPLVTNDPADDFTISLTSETAVSFAWNPTFAFPTDNAANPTGEDRTAPYHGPSRRIKGVLIDFSSGQASRPIHISTMLKLLHGTMMGTIWLINGAVGVWVARYKRHVRGWIHTHKLLQGLGTFITWPNYVLALTYTKDATTPHAIVGICIVFLTTFQAFLGLYTRAMHRFLLERAYREKKPPKSALGRAWTGLLRFGASRRLDLYSSATHRWLGKVLLLVALVQIFLGLERFSMAASLSAEIIRVTNTVYISWVVLMLLLFVVKEATLQLGIVELEPLQLVNYACSASYRRRYKARTQVLEERRKRWLKQSALNPDLRDTILKGAGAATAPARGSALMRGADWAVGPTSDEGRHAGELASDRGDVAKRPHVIELERFYGGHGGTGGGGAADDESEPPEMFGVARDGASVGGTGAAPRRRNKLHASVSTQNPLQAAVVRPGATPSSSRQPGPVSRAEGV